MPCSSVLVLVVNLAKNLSDQSSTLMKLPDGTIVVDKYSLKVEDMLKQVFSVVASNTKHFRSMIKNQRHIKPPKNEKLQVITIGTHGDECDKGVKDIEKKSAELKSILRSKSIQIAYKDNAQLLHEVDGSKAKRGEFDDDPAINAIRKALNEQAYQIEVPLQWHCFGVILRNEAKDTGILELSSCEEFGESLGMSKDDVQSALQFFHALKLLFYYHDSPAKGIVFVKLDAVINIIRKLMIAVCKPRSTLEAGPDELAQLASKGYLSMNVLKMYAGALEGREDILLGLFVHLKIAALIQTGESDQTNEEDAVFLMPALLPVKDVSDASTFSKTPLLYYFNDEPVPMGLFCAVIVQLLSYPDDEKWHIITKEHNFSNFFTIQKKINKYRMCKVLLVEQLYCIEIYCEEPRHRPSANKCIKKAINYVIEDKISNYEKPVATFYCPCKDKKQHIATVEDNVLIKCSRTDEWQDLSDSQCDEYWSWFMTQEELDEAKCERQEGNPSSTLEGDPKGILRDHSGKLVDAIAVDVIRIANELHSANGLIPQQTKQEMLVGAVDNYAKSSKLVNVIQQLLGASLNPKQYLINICHVLIDQQHCILRDIATSMLHQLGQSIPDSVHHHSPVDDVSET
ncbi:PREDICTED: uncharacterized protein LOC109591029 [Amphimedon queenslandica]|uniref:C-terminal of Roc (COR) domain-containing protein n=1 Tax=Amphimedon queenslandica TaxID=400682 RepID=A0A1X7SXA6_AMPQE|nr:PREDICTED: uncharacterized protein LOC109591029 [Amphimedon queenslandica]|eukprot:XP_019862402.1 PREDICTED: uncharacterized protein LOC109591029 [Amphimedon queenslandica]